MKIYSVLAIMIMALALAGTASAQVLPIVVEEVEIDDTLLAVDAVNRLDLERGNTYDVEVLLTALENIRDAEMTVFVSGFEFNDIVPLRADTHVFDLDAGVTKRFRLKLFISDEVEEDDYKMRLMINDRFGEPIFLNFNLKLDVPRHSLQIEDINFVPGNNVQAGNALLTTVRVENKGEKDEDDVKVQISIPELGVIGADYIDLIEFDEEEESEEIFVRIPETAKSGTYNLHVEAIFDEGFDRVTKTFPLTVVGNPRFQPPTEGGEPVGPVTLTVGTQLETAQAGADQGALYPVTVKNNGRDKRTFSVAVQADFANVKVNPSSTLLIDGGDEQLFSIWVTPKKDATPGPQSFTVKVNEGSTTIKELQFTTNVLPAEKWDVGAALGVLVVLLVLGVLLAGGIMLYRRMQEERDADLETPETYY